MPRGTNHPEALRQEARRLRQQGWSLGEISRKLGPPKNTLTAWVRDISLSAEQQAAIHEREILASGRNHALAMEAHRQARLDRISQAGLSANLLLESITNQHLANHISAAMLYLGEGAKGDGQFRFANSNPRVIRYWLYLLRTSFMIDEAKFRIQIMYRADQDETELIAFWTNVTGITQFIKGHIDPRTRGKPTLRSDYRGVCCVLYHNIALRRYLDAVAERLMNQAEPSAE